MKNDGSVFDEHGSEMKEKKSDGESVSEKSAQRIFMVCTGWLAGWLVGRSEGNDVCHNGGMRVLDFYPIYIHTQTSYTHFDRATFQFDEILEQSIKIPFFIIIIISIRNAYYYSTSWGVYCLFIAKNIKRHSNKIDILIIWPVWYCTQDAVVHMVNIYTHSYPHSAPYTHTFSVCVCIKFGPKIKHRFNAMASNSYTLNRTLAT